MRSKQQHDGFTGTFSPFAASVDQEQDANQLFEFDTHALE